MRDYLEFEKPLREIEEKIEKLLRRGSVERPVQEELRNLKVRLAQDEAELYSKSLPGNGLNSPARATPISARLY